MRRLMDEMKRQAEMELQRVVEEKEKTVTRLEIIADVRTRESVRDRVKRKREGKREGGKWRQKNGQRCQWDRVILTFSKLPLLFLFPFSSPSPSFT